MLMWVIALVFEANEEGGLFSQNTAVIFNKLATSKFVTHQPMHN
jgi:hypothetical protein